MKNSIVLTTLVFCMIIPLHSQAFHQITEVLQSNKILICRDYNEIRTGRNVEVYKMTFSRNRAGRELEKTNEYILPEVGKKIDLYHKEIHRNGRFLFSTHELKLGTATVVEPDLVGEIRNIIEVDQGKMKSMIKKEEIIGEKEAEKLTKNCIVALSDSIIDLKDVQTIVY